MENGEENRWKDAKFFLNGIEIKGIRQVSYNCRCSINEFDLPNLKKKLKDALEVEDYLLCAEIQKQIDNLKTK